MRFFLGGYTPSLHSVELNPADGSMKIAGSMDTPENGSFLCYVPELSALYAAVETGSRKEESGTVAAYHVGDSGQLYSMRTVESCGPGPCHIAVNADERVLTVANYVGGNFALYDLGDDGRPGEQLACVAHSGSGVHATRQEGPHAHGTTFSPDGTSVFVCDLGIDKVVTYALHDLCSGRSGGAAAAGPGSGAGEAAPGGAGADGPGSGPGADPGAAGAAAGGPDEAAPGVGATPVPGGTVAAEAAPGSGPRHLEFSSDGNFAYLVTELANTVVVYRHEATTGTLEQIQEISTLPDDYAGESTAAEIQIHPNGRFIYASNRGHDSVAVFARDESSGLLEARGHFSSGGSGPRHFQVDPSGRWCVVANQFSDSVLSFRLDPETGLGTPTGELLTSTAPSCVEFERN